MSYKTIKVRPSTSPNHKSPIGLLKERNDLATMPYYVGFVEKEGATYKPLITSQDHRFETLEQASMVYNNYGRGKAWYK